MARGDLKSHLTFAGHSYGSFAIGAAASDKGGLHAGDIIALGSPGTGVSWADQLNIDPNHVWVGQSADDPTRLVGGWTPGNPALVGFGGHNIVHRRG
ncbi:alpha/beta hydrolase [Kitasatospora sp. NPDC050543]|uniref:alpha/beta hydrolase n=1 Tax=Kitasatospora sp. NPDC050543 TaxID=3364054 RepID=UPI0037AFF98C